MKIFSNEIGRLTLAALLVVIAYPVLYFGITSQNTTLEAIGLAIVVVGLGLEPIASFVVSSKK